MGVDIEIKCPSCRSSKLISLGEAYKASFFCGLKIEGQIPDSLLFECNECGLLFKYPTFSKKELDCFYSKLDIHNWDCTIEKRNDWKIAKNWIKNYLFSILNDEITVLDVACWTGNFLESLKDNKKLKLYGVEINPTARKIAEEKGITIIANDILDLNRADYKFDIITAFDIIEHLQNPYEFMSILKNIVKENGIIIIATGNSDSLAWRIMGKNKYVYSAYPEHISFINKKWCEYISKKLSLKVEMMTEFRKYNFGLFNYIYTLFLTGIYRICPAVFSLMRRIKNSIERKEQTCDWDFPPFWTGWKDHFLVVFKIQKE
ncbi:MAG: class I SAM-dependent methyltransferase [Nitrososphaeria archaeon]